MEICIVIFYQPGPPLRTPGEKDLVVNLFNEKCAQSVKSLFSTENCTDLISQRFWLHRTYGIDNLVCFSHLDGIVEVK